MTMTIAIRKWLENVAPDLVQRFDDLEEEERLLLSMMIIKMGRGWEK